MTQWRDLLAGRWQAFALIMLGMWLMAADSLVTATIMPSVGTDLSGFAWFGWATSGFLIGLVVAGACAGWLADRYGLRNVMALSGVILAAGCLLSALSPSMLAFVIGRIVQGIAAGWVSGFAYVMISMVFPERHLPRVFAAATSVWGIATLL
ncbi:MAG: MFS transporter, partial [Polymorphobacter sp.]